MVYKLQDFVIRKGIYIEIAAATIFLQGVAFHFITIPNDKIFVIIGGLMLCGLYVVYYITLKETLQAKTSFDIFLCRLFPLTLAMIIAGVIRVISKSEMTPFLWISLILLIISMVLLIYNKISLKSNFNPGVIYYFRIIIIAGIGILVTAYYY